MINMKNVINALPLVADALGRKYGVKVHIGGNRAYTDGKNIHLPSLPLDSDETILNLARGYLDHEAAHLRLTNFDILNKANLTPIEKHVWNIIEDFVVERKLAAIYPGCQQNFTWLIKHLFLKESAICEAETKSSADNIFDWLLIFLRSLAVPELVAETERLEECLERDYPILLNDLKPLAKLIPDKCLDTASCISWARKIVGLLKDYVEYQPQQPQQKAANKNTQDGNSDNKDKKHDASNAQNVDDSESDGDSCENEESSTNSNSGELDDNSIDSARSSSDPSNTANPSSILKELLDAPSSLQKSDIGTKASELLESVCGDRYSENLTVAVERPFSGTALSAKEITDIRQKTGALRTRLGGLLQSKILSRNHAGHTGKLDYRLIARLAASNPRVFAKHSEKQGINTAVHILLDASSSMRTNGKITLACHACYAVAYALDKISGVSVAVSSFPNGETDDDSQNNGSWATVGTILTANSKFHNKFAVYSNGGTPMAEALWWVLQQIRNLSSKRKIVLILSDGEPDNVKETQNAIEAHHSCGHEVYGIGIATSYMNSMIDSKSCKSIYDLQELAPAIFELLQTSMLKPQGGL